MALKRAASHACLLKMVFLTHHSLLLITICILVKPACGPQPGGLIAPGFYSTISFEVHRPGLLSCHYACPDEGVWKLNDETIPRCSEQPKSTSTCMTDEHKLNFSAVAYSDKGDYYFNCGSKELCTYQVFVLVPMQKPVLAGDQVLLNAYASISRRTRLEDLHVIWKNRDKNQTVVEWKKGNLTFGPGYEERVSLNVEDLLKGNLSLLISSVTEQDQGLYWCLHSGKDYRFEEAHPNAFNLIVGTGHNGTDGSICRTGLMIFLGFTGIIIAIVAVIVWKKTSAKCPVPSLNSGTRRLRRSEQETSNEDQRQPGGHSLPPSVEGLLHQGEHVQPDPDKMKVQNSSTRPF